MYQPPAFKETRPEILADLIRKSTLATMVCNGEDGPVANHLPMFLKGDGADRWLLQAHLSRGNDLINAVENGAPCLAIFQGAAHYVTPSWYPGKKEHGKVVPTYNYIVVHARGKLRFIEDPQWLLSHLNDLTGQMETGRAEPWSVGDAPEDFTARQLKGIYGIELEVQEMHGKWKVSQNQTAENRKG